MIKYVNLCIDLMKIEIPFRKREKHVTLPVKMMYSHEVKS